MEMDGIIMAFVAGLLGSGHCLGMCGSLVSAFFIRFVAPERQMAAAWSYHGGRIAVYTLVGVLAGALGMVLTSAGLIGKIQGVMQIIAGGVVIALGLDLLGLSWFRVNHDSWPMNRLHHFFMRAGERGPIQGAWAGGMVNGLMPCSLTLAMAVKATTVEHALGGGALMLAFGLGTLPAMLLVSTAFTRLGATMRGRLLKAAAVVVIALGAGTLIQGIRYFNVMRQLADY
ncbi:MAG: sulfite exporter TauE/SafE family protein [Magnetococcales bacterium]|nr:sulfite exporter TauE/SafE family protein [Magnetococcales bacterium]